MGRRASILTMLAEGTRLRATARMADVSFNTVVKLLLDVAESASSTKTSMCAGSKRSECRSMRRGPSCTPKDGFKVYLEAVEGAFGNAIDYARLVKTFEGDSGKRATAERRYSPAVCTGAVQQRITGNPDAHHISTSFVERQNLTMRISMRRFTRLTNAFSKKLDNHKAAVALYFMWYNFARIRQALRVTPSMEAGV
jgi:hypothetical protein